MKNEKKRLLRISGSLFILNLLILVSLPNSPGSLVYLMFLLPILYFVTGPFLIISTISALLTYNEIEQKYPWLNLRMRIFITFFIIIFILFIPNIVFEVLGKLIT